jgi:PAS domain S-box-containing protein
MQSTLIDITERKRAEEDLEKEFRMRTNLLDNIPGCIALILKKGTREIVASNRFARELGAVPGQICFKTYAMRDDNCPFCLAPTLWTTGQSQRLEVEYRGTWYEGIWAPLSEDLYVHYIFDITERKRVEDALRRSERFLQLISNSLPVQIAYVDQSQVYRFVNKAYEDKYQISRDSVIGMRVNELLPEEANVVMLPFIERVLGGEQVEYEMNQTLEGKELAVSVNYVPHRDDEGSVVGFFALIQDITDLKRAENALQKAHDKLEKRVEERTSELAKVNEQLNREIEESKQAEEALRVKTHDLGERVKELKCLYGISHLAEKPDISLDAILRVTVGLIPSSWQYPEITCSRVILEGREFTSDNFQDTTWKQSSDILVYGEQKGTVEVCYMEERPETDEGPFLKEHRDLINAIAARLGRIAETMQAEKTVKERGEELVIKARNLEEVNTALRVLLQKREEDKTKIEENVLSNIKELVEPYLDKLKKSDLDVLQMGHLSVLESNLNDVISPFSSRLSSKFLNLSPSEIRIANLVKQGKNTKEIAELMSLSSTTVATHRRNIRKKLGISDKKANLRTHLLSAQ